MEPSGTRAIAPAHGTLAATPLAHVLIYIRNKRLTGSLELRAFGGREARFDFWRGGIVTAQTTPVVARFGSVVYELGWIDAEALDEATETSAREQTPVADLLLAAKAITPAQRDDVLAEQVRRRVHYTFTFPPTATFTFQERAPAAIEPPLMVDVLAPIWRGILDFPPEVQVATVLDRLGDAPLTMVSEAALERADFAEPERRVCEALAHAPMSRREAHRFLSIGARVDQLIYLLVIAKCAEPVAVADANVNKPAETAETAADAMGSKKEPKEGPPRRRSFELSYMKVPAAMTAMPVLEESRPAIIVSPEDLGVEGIRIRAGSLAFETPHEALGLFPHASPEATRAAYVRLSRLWHPDHLPVSLRAVSLDAAIIFQHITEAYQALTDASAPTDADERTAAAARRRTNAAS